MRIAFAGNPNSGKTTMYNALTGRNERVGNWAGVTVERKESPIKKGYYDGTEELVAVDLPGAYSMSPFTSEESITSGYVKNENPDVIINIVDATNLSRSLFFTTQLLELGIPVVVALNKSDIVNKKQTKIDEKILSEKLGCPVIKTISTSSGHEGLKETVNAAAALRGKGQKAPYVQGDIDFKDKTAVEAADRKRFEFVNGIVKQVEKRKVFTKKEIEEYIKSNSKVPQELLELKYKELFEGKKLNNQERKRKEDLENQPEDYITEEEALEKLKIENEEQIQACRHRYSEESFNSKLEQDIRYGFIQVCSNPKDFQLRFNEFVTPKILKGNTEFTMPNNENGNFDFLVNQAQIVMINHLGVQLIEVYVPDKEYPEGMTRSALIQKEKSDACEEELKALYQKFQQQGVDVSAVSKRILGLEREDFSEQAK